MLERMLPKQALLVAAILAATFSYPGVYEAREPAARPEKAEKRTKLDRVLRKAVQRVYRTPGQATFVELPVVTR